MKVGQYWLSCHPFYVPMTAFLHIVSALSFTLHPPTSSTYSVKPVPPTQSTSVLPTPSYQPHHSFTPAPHNLLYQPHLLFYTRLIRPLLTRSYPIHLWLAPPTWTHNVFPHSSPSHSPMATVQKTEHAPLACISRSHSTSVTLSFPSVIFWLWQ